MNCLARGRSVGDQVARRLHPTIKVARAFPNTMFEHATGYKTAKNAGNYIIRFEEGR